MNKGEGEIKKAIERWKKDFQEALPESTDKCPKCGSKNIENLELDTEQFTEGQLAEHMAGNIGTMHCRDCNYVWDYGW